jgi:hypothetical protein
VGHPAQIAVGVGVGALINPVSRVVKFVLRKPTNPLPGVCHAKRRTGRASRETSRVGHRPDAWTCDEGVGRIGGERGSEKWKGNTAHYVAKSSVLERFRPLAGCAGGSSRPGCGIGFGSDSVSRTSHKLKPDQIQPQTWGQKKAFHRNETSQPS